MSETRVHPIDSPMVVLDAMVEFGDRFCQLLGEASIDPVLASIRRDRLVPEVMQLGRLRNALSHRASLGLYGESQCGKSFLVSRMAKHLGAKETSAGSLLVMGQMDGAPDGVEFKRYVNPEAAQEATGLICRFSLGVGDGDAPDGTWILEIASMEDVIAMVAIGFDVSHQSGDVDDRRQAIRSVLSKLRRGGTVGCEAIVETDEGSVFEEAMPRLSDVWKRMRSGAIKIDKSRIDDLDNGDEGWDELVLELLRQKVRPRVEFGGTQSGLDELVSLLWEQEPMCTRLWHHLHRGLRDLGFATRVAVRIEDVCKRADSSQQSLADIALLRDPLLAEIEHGRGMKIQVMPLDGRRKAEWVPIGRATLAALGTVLNLPLIPDAPGRDGPAGVPRIDVLDFPGARSLQFTRVAQYSRFEDLLQTGFVRGKVAYLFDSSVQAHEATVLCLAVKSKGNEEAAGVSESIRIWLDREGWKPRQRQVDSSLPPLIMAVTRADELFLDLAKNESTSTIVLRDRLDQIGKRYSSTEADWWSRWSGEGGVFDRVHWVHDPSANGASGFRAAVASLHEEGSESALRLRLRSQWSEGAVSSHTRLDLLEAVVPLPWSFAGYLDECRRDKTAAAMVDRTTAESSKVDGAPRDIDRLFDRIKEIAAPAVELRERRLLDSAIGPCRTLLGRFFENYRGPCDEARADQVRREALAHVSLLEGILADHPDVIAETLEVFSLPPDAVLRAFRRARQEDVFRTGDGEQRFKVLHKQLIEVLGNRLSKCGLEGSRQGLWDWRRMVADESVPMFEAFLKRLERMPRLPMFVDRLRGSVISVMEEEDPAAISEHAISEVVATIWSRLFVWCGELPGRRHRPEHLPPKLRRRSEASGRILRRWRDLLPGLYVEMEDPNGQSSELNACLQKLISPVLAAVKHVERYDDEFVSEIRLLLAKPSNKLGAIEE